MADYCETGLHTQMAWRVWYQFHVAAIKAKERNIYYLDAASKATEDHWNYGRCGNYKAGGISYSYHTLFKPKHDFSLEPGADEIVTIGVYYKFKQQEFSWPGVTRFSEQFYVLGDPPAGGIDYERVSSLYYDGENEWPSYAVPERWDYSQNANMNSQTQPPADQCDDCGLGPPPTSGCPYTTAEFHDGFNWLYAYFAGAVIANKWQDEFFTNGGVISIDRYYDGDWTPYPGEGKKAIYYCFPEKIKAYYFNPIVNSISPNRYPESGGDLILEGLGFQIPNINISAYHWGGFNWEDHVYKIQFIGKQSGTIYEIEDAAFPTVKFIQTNTSITILAAEIAALSLPRDSYKIRLIKKNGKTPADMDYPEGDAGDWRAKDNGEIYRGDLLYFHVDMEEAELGPPLFFWNWTWKWGDDTINERYAPIDVRGDDHFWEGRIMGTSSLTRSIDDFTGLYNISDVSITLANNDMHFSKRLSRYFAKGQIAALTYGTGGEIETYHDQIFYGIVDDYDLGGPNFNATMKDLSQRFFVGQQPRYLITEEDFPDCLDNAKGQPIPSILGRHSLTTGDAKGAIEAQCIDTTANQYVCADGPLHSILQVYSDGVLIDPADYTLSLNVDGWQLLTFDNSQSNNKITFNCTGFIFGLWDSTNGYVQNPAYIIAFYLALLLEIPIGFIDLDSINTVATIFEDAGWGTAGKRAITSLEDKNAVLQDLLYSFGIKFWQGKDGLFKIGRKDISDITPVLTFHTQIQGQGPTSRLFNLNEAVNSIKAIWDYYPAADKYSGSSTHKETPSITMFDAELGPKEPWTYPCTDSDTLAQQRIVEDITRLAYGKNEAKITVPLEYINQIDIFDTFAIQDPFGLSWTKQGEVGRLYYVKSLTYNWESRTIDIIGVDLQYLLQRYFIFGDEDEMPEFWADSGFYYRLYGYMCDEETDAFGDEYPGKELIDENLIEEQ